MAIKNKEQLIDAIFDKTGITKKDINTVLTVAFDIIKDEVLTKEGDIVIKGFGKFKCYKSNVKTMKGNQFTKGADCVIPAKKYLRFNASHKLATKI